MERKEKAEIWVDWGYELHSLTLDSDDWAAVKAGEEITIDGEGYGYEGEVFSDTWRCKGGIGGELRVTYCGEEEKSESDGQHWLAGRGDDRSPSQVGTLAVATPVLTGAFPFRNSLLIKSGGEGS